MIDALKPVPARGQHDIGVNLRKRAVATVITVWALYLILVWSILDLAYAVMAWNAAFSPATDAAGEVHWGTVSSQWQVTLGVMLGAVVLGSVVWYFVAGLSKVDWRVMRFAVACSALLPASVAASIVAFAPEDFYYRWPSMAMFPGTWDGVARLAIMSVVVTGSSALAGQLARRNIDSRITRCR